MSKKRAGLLLKIVGAGCLLAVLNLTHPLQAQSTQVTLKDEARVNQILKEQEVAGISRQGDKTLRRLLVQGAQYQLGRFGPDCDLKRFGLRIAESGGRHGKKRAIIAVARKLAFLLHRLWTTGEVYDPFYNSQPRGAVAAQAALTA